MLELPVLEGWQIMRDSHRVVGEELQPVVRIHVEKVLRELFPMGRTLHWRKGRDWRKKPYRRVLN